MCGYVTSALCVCAAGKQLKVFSLTAGKKKTLYDSCAGHFSTAPEVPYPCSVSSSYYTCGGVQSNVA